GQLLARLGLRSPDAVEARRSPVGSVPGPLRRRLRLAHGLLGAGTPVSLTRVLSFLAFGSAAALCVLVELLARSRRSKIPTFGDVCAFVMGYRVGRLPVGRIAVFGFWWWVGWHFIAR